MRQYTVFIFPLILAGVLVTGCKKWLDVKPKTQVEQTRMLSTEGGYQDAMYGAYTIMGYPAVYGDNLTMSFLDVLAQRYDCQAKSGHTFYQAAIYNYQDPSVKNRISNIWDSLYSAIANVNNVLANINKDKDLFVPGNYVLVKGEALGLRAFMHFDLLRLFAPSYISGPAKPGIPYVTTVSGGVTPQYTVSAVLDSIIRDLTAADALLGGYKNIAPGQSDQSYLPLANDWLNNRQSHFNYWAAEATLARVCLYKGDKVNAFLHASNVIGSGMFHFTTSSQITVFKDRTYTWEHIFALSKYNLLNQINNYFQSSGSGTSNMNANNQLTNSYGNGGVVDQVYEIASGGVSDFRYAFGWQLSSSIYFPSKFWQDGLAGYYNNLVPLIRLPEMYYIAAESSDPATATGFLNKVRENRGLSDLPAGLSQTVIQNEIFKEYQKEFYCEGQLFYYYKRLNLPQIRFSVVPGSDRIYVFPLPDAELQYGGH